MATPVKQKRNQIVILSPFPQCEWTYYVIPNIYSSWMGHFDFLLHKTGICYQGVNSTHCRSKFRFCFSQSLARWIDLGRYLGCILAKSESEEGDTNTLRLDGLSLKLWRIPETEIMGIK